VATGAMPSAARADVADRFNITVVKVNNLSNFQRFDQRKEYRRRAEDILAKVRHPALPPPPMARCNVAVWNGSGNSQNAPAPPSPLQHTAPKPAPSYTSTRQQ
jgi:hypothetical protein